MDADRSDSWALFENRPARERTSVSDEGTQAPRYKDAEELRPQRRHEIISDERDVCRT